MAKAKDYSGAGIMHGRLDTAAGDQGDHMPKLNPELYGRDPETVNLGGPGTQAVDGSVAYEQTANNALGSAVKEQQTIDPMDHTQVGALGAPERAGSNDVANFQAGSEVNPSVPVDASGQVDEDGNYVSNVPASMPDGTINTASVASEVPGVNEDGSLEEGEDDSDAKDKPTPASLPDGTINTAEVAEVVPGVNDDGSAQENEVDNSALVSKEAIGEPTGDTPAEALAKETEEETEEEDGEEDLNELTREDLLKRLPDEGAGHKSANKDELIALVQAHEAETAPEAEA